MDSDVSLSLRWVWLGHPAVTHIGGISDFDFSILLALVRGVNWSTERDLAIESVEGYEQEVLRAAQVRRRQKQVGPRTKLAPAEMAPTPPMSVEGKRVMHRATLARAGYRDASDAQMRKQAAIAASKPSVPVWREFKGGQRVPQHGLTSSRGTVIRDWQWSSYRCKEEMMDALCAQPAGTFRYLSIYGLISDIPDDWRKAWDETRYIREAVALGAGASPQ